MTGMEKIVEFEGLKGKWSYEKIAYRAPRQGEFYLSGAIVKAWKAPHDLLDAHHIVTPLVQHRQKSSWVPA